MVINLVFFIIFLSSYFILKIENIVFLDFISKTVTPEAFSSLLYLHSFRQQT